VADEQKDKIQISLAQVAASSLAAVSAAVVCSFFGVAGTVIGTAIASVCATVGSALYAHSLRRTKARLRQLHQAGAVSPPFTEVLETTRRQWRRWFGEVPWRTVAIGTAAVFVFSIALVTVVELGVGEPLSTLFGVGHSGAKTSIGLGHRSKHHTSTPTPASTSSTQPSPTAVATVTQTVTATPSAKPTVTPTTPTASPTKPSPTPSVTSSTPTVSPPPKTKK
jgi:hypothetical protein